MRIPRLSEAFFGVCEQHAAFLSTRNRLKVLRRLHNEVARVFTKKRLARRNPEALQHRRHMSDSNHGEPTALVIHRIELVLHKVFLNGLLCPRKSHGPIPLLRYRCMSTSPGLAFTSNCALAFKAVVSCVSTLFYFEFPGEVLTAFLGAHRRHWVVFHFAFTSQHALPFHSHVAAYRRRSFSARHFFRASVSFCSRRISRLRSEYNGPGCPCLPLVAPGCPRFALIAPDQPVRLRLHYLWYRAIV